MMQQVLIGDFLVCVGVHDAKMQLLTVHKCVVAGSAKQDNPTLAAAGRAAQVVTHM